MMDVFLWVLTGAAIAWVGLRYLGMNEERGLAAALGIGAVGGYVGGSLLAPMFVTTASHTAAGDFSSDALLFAGLVAIAFLALSNHLAKRSDA